MLETVKENKNRIGAEQGMNMSNQCWGAFKEGDHRMLSGLYCHHCLFHFSMYSCDCICLEQGFQQEHMQ